MKFLKRLLPLVPLIILSGCTEPQFTASNDSGAVTGHGGVSRTIHGMDVWGNGTPDRRFRILGTLQSEGSTRSTNYAEMERVVAAAKKLGADALILTESTRGDVPGGSVGWPRVKAMAIKYL